CLILTHFWPNSFSRCPEYRFLMEFCRDSQNTTHTYSGRSRRPLPEYVWVVFWELRQNFTRNPGMVGLSRGSTPGFMVEFYRGSQNTTHTYSVRSRRLLTEYAWVVFWESRQNFTRNPGMSPWDNP